MDEEAARLLEASRHAGTLEWEPFFATWFSIVRRVVFGDSDDHRLTNLMTRLRSRGNWAFMMPAHRRLRRELLSASGAHPAR